MKISGRAHWSELSASALVREAVQTVRSELLLEGVESSRAEECVVSLKQRRGGGKSLSDLPKIALGPSEREPPLPT